MGSPHHRRSGRLGLRHSDSDMDGVSEMKVYVVVDTSDSETSINKIAFFSQIKAMRWVDEKEGEKAQEMKRRGIPWVREWSNEGGTLSWSIDELEVIK